MLCANHKIFLPPSVSGTSAGVMERMFSVSSYFVISCMSLWLSVFS